MDAVAMARPPPKRRKLSNPWREYRAVSGGDRPPAFAHAVEPLEDALPAQPAVDGIESHRRLLPRQGTAMSSASATTSMPASSSSSSQSSATGVATPTSPEVAVSLSVSLSVPGVQTPISAISGILSGVSGLLAPSETPQSNTSPPNDTTTSPGSSASSNPAPSTSSGNDTSSISSTLPAGSATSTNSDDSTNSSTTSSTSSSLASSGFLTSSFSRNSTTSALSTGGSTATSSSSSLTSTGSASFFIATLSQGGVTTLSRSSNDYTATVDGNIFTISATPTVLSGASRSSDSISSASFSDSISSGAVTTTTGGAGEYSSNLNAAPTSTGSSSDSDSNNNSTPPAGTIAGGVVGGAAGLAVVVLIAMLALRWYRRKGMSGHQALPQGPVNSPNPNAPSGSGAPGPGMAQRAGMIPLIGAVPALFRNQSRRGGRQETGERGFTRVAGRKLPSAFDGGQAMPSSNAPETRDPGTNLNGTSFYRDSNGIYGGESTAGSPPSPTGSNLLRHNSDELMTISPGPQRMPKLHSGGPYNLSPIGSVGPSSPQAASADITRSDAPFLLDPNRESRFNEEL